MKQIRVSAGQFELTHEIEHNLKHIDLLSRKASGEGSRLVLFPECAVTGYPGADMTDLSAVEPVRVQEALDQIAGLSKKLKIFIATGVAIPIDDGNGWTNSLIVFDDAGEKTCIYSKTALTYSDKGFFTSGGSDPVFMLDDLTIGCQICFDVRFAEGYRRLFRKGVHLVLHSYHQAGTRHWRQRRDVMQAFQRVRCSENGIYALTSNTIGHNGGKDQWIPTMIVNPIGEVIDSLKPSAADVLTATIDAEDLIEMIELDIRQECARQLNIDVPGLRPIPKKNIR